MRVINLPRLESEASALAEAFSRAQPFRHLVVEDFLYPDAAEAILAHYPAVGETEWTDTRTYKHQRGKYQKSLLDGPIKPFFDETADPAFLALMARITGIDELEADPELFGGGLHQIEAGGFLDVHVDFNLHPTTRHYRRLNLLVYLNKDWLPDYGGALELWDMQGKRCAASIAPLFNRALLFETSEISFHGHPKPLSPPPGRTRKSLSVYYYTEKIGPLIAPDEHNTLYRNTEGLAGAVRVLKAGAKAAMERTAERSKR